MSEFFILVIAFLSNMKRIRTLLVIFDEEIRPFEIEAFRGAVIQKAGLENTVFHNHYADGRYVYQYPLIQYKAARGKPVLFCVDQGVDEVHHFFTNKNWDVHISGRTLHLKISRLDLKSCNLNVWNQHFNYRISHWLALNQENYKKYLGLHTDDDRRQMLARILTGNVISFAKSVKWEVDKPVETRITEMVRQKTMLYKNNKLLAFDVIFSANVSLPDWLSLGKGASHGFGVIRRMKMYKTVATIS
ncbi:MAG: hypothetical protein KatS3mg031_2757 [Chitinophagales bacterium]|nr:MAG: hypothetical protein KatS3mg031_2757 [Chitinophagales bacterium]